VERSIITIRPRFEGGYDLYRSEEWAGSALTLDLVRALAHREAQKEADRGLVGLVVMTNMRGDLESVLEWIDPPTNVVRLPDAVERVAGAREPAK
jgi:hypothetical protein